MLLMAQVLIASKQFIIMVMTVLKSLVYLLLILKYFVKQSRG